MKTTTLQLAMIVMVLCTGCARTQRNRQAELERDLLRARKEYGATLLRFWKGTTSDSITLQGHLCAYAVDFAKTTDSGIVDAIIDDLRPQASRYTDEYKSAFGRQTIYAHLLQGLPRKETILRLEKWFDSAEYRDPMYASNLLEDLRMFKVNKEKVGFYYYEFRSAEDPVDGLPNQALKATSEPAPSAASSSP